MYCADIQCATIQSIALNIVFLFRNVNETQHFGGPAEYMMRAHTPEEAGWHGVFINELTYRINTLMGYEEALARTNRAMSIWGIQDHTVGQSFVVDVFITQLLPCLPVSGGKGGKVYP
jgi:hypothetical protein